MAVEQPMDTLHIGLNEALLQQGCSLPLPHIPRAHDERQKADLKGKTKAYSVGAKCLWLFPQGNENYGLSAWRRDKTFDADDSDARKVHLCGSGTRKDQMP